MPKSRFYDARGVRAHRRHPRRRRGHPHALGNAEGAAPALRAPADPVARRGGARGRRRQGRRRRQPEAALEDRLPEGVERRGPARANGTGDAVAAAARTSTPTRPCSILTGDVPLITAEAIERLVGAHEASGARATMATMASTTPAVGRVVRNEDGSCSRSSRPRPTGDATPEELAINEVNTGIYAFDGGALLEALQIDSRQRAGRALPPRRAAASSAAGQDDRRPPGQRRHAHARRQRPRAPRRIRGSPSSASTTRTPATA